MDSIYVKAVYKHYPNHQVYCAYEAGCAGSMLTAGIVHEIKNPLNFINNFAGINRRLVTEILMDYGIMEQAFRRICIRKFSPPFLQPNP